MTKTCLACTHEFPVESFRLMTRADGRTQRHPRCDTCRKEYHKQYYQAMTTEQKKNMSRKSTLAKYGLTPEEYDKMFDEQDGKCAVCGREPEGTGVSRHNLVVDHDHVSGITRSLLCDFCNRGLGIFRDDPDLLINAALYLIKHQGGDDGAVHI